LKESDFLSMRIITFHMFEDTFNITLKSNMKEWMREESLIYWN